METPRLRRSVALTRMAVRNIARNPRRTGLSAAAIGVCVAFVWISVALTVAMLDRTVATATEGFLGHVQIHDAGYAEDPQLDNTIPLALVERIEAAAADATVPASVVAAPRIYAEAYATAGRLASGSMLVGFDPTRERASSGFDEDLRAGRYPSDQNDPGVLIGEGLAERLAVTVGDPLELVTSTRTGQPATARVEIIGTVATGIVELDDAGVFMTLGPTQALIGLTDQVHEIGIRGPDPDQAPALAAALRPVVTASSPSAVVETWREISPDIAMFVDLSAGMFGGFAIVIILVVGTAILLSQSMIVFERRAELGLLRAIGLRPRQLLLVLVIESCLVALIGALVGLALGGLCLEILAHTGLDLSGGTEMEMSGVTVSPIVYPQLDARVPIQSLITTVGLAGLASVIAGLRTALRGPMGVIRDA